MFLDIQIHRKNPIGIIRDSYRDDAGKVKHHCYGRITGKTLEELKRIKAAFNKEFIEIENFKTTDSREFGACNALMQLAKKCGLAKALHSK